MSIRPGSIGLHEIFTGIRKCDGVGEKTKTKENNKKKINKKPSRTVRRATQHRAKQHRRARRRDDNERQRVNARAENVSGGVEPAAHRGRRRGDAGVGGTFSSPRTTPPLAHAKALLLPRYQADNTARSAGSTYDDDFRTSFSNTQ